MLRTKPVWGLIPRQGKKQCAFLKTSGQPAKLAFRIRLEKPPLTNDKLLGFDIIGTIPERVDEN